MSERPSGRHRRPMPGPDRDTATELDRCRAELAAERALGESFRARLADILKLLEGKP